MNKRVQSHSYHKYIYFILISLFTIHPVFSQRIIGDLETNSEANLMMNDSTRKEKNKDTVVPVDIYAWNIDSKYGNITPTFVDTLHHQFQNNNLSEGINGHYNSLGNLGSPRLSRIFMERSEQPQFIFSYPFDQFIVRTENFRFYNTKSPYMNISYNACGSKETGDDHVKVTYTNNVNKRMNFGGIFDYMYGQGYYANQSTSLMNATAFASYLGKRYNLHFYFMHNFIKMAENGGIEDEIYITNPESLTEKYSTNDIPTRLSQTWNRQENNIAFLTHQYNFGFTKASEDSTSTEEIYIPVTKIFHTLKLKKNSKNYKAYTTPDNYHSYTYLPGDSANDKTKHFAVKNIVGLSLCEGFNKWAVAGINAYIGFDYNQFTLPDTINSNGFGSLNNGRQNKKKYSEHNVLIGGQIIRSQSRSLRYNIDAEYIIEGDQFGDFKLSGKGELDFPLLRDTAQLAIKGYIKNQTPGFYYGTFHSKHAWWDIERKREFRSRIEGIVTIPNTKTKLTVGIENIKNYAYFSNNGTSYKEGSQTLYTYNVTPMQHGENIQIISANLLQNFKFGIFHLDNDITFQYTSNKDIIPLPTLSLYHNLYIKFKIAKVLACEMGADMKYFTEYYAPDYSPVINQFMNQNPNDKIKIGNYPIISAYLNFDLKRTRFYIQYYHANQSTGRYFWAPNYPINPAGVHFGLSWNFYD